LLRFITLVTCLSLGLAACDPCSGIIGCANGRYLAAAGQMVDATSGVGLEGVRIDVIRTGGIEVAEDSVSTTTSRDGFWRADFVPTTEGALIADVQVSTPGYRPYRLHGVQIQTRKTAGDASLNERWVPTLYFDFIAEFYLKGSTDIRPQGIPVEFRRTAGAPLAGPGQVAGVYRARTNAAGQIHLFPTTGDSAVFAIADDTLVGNFVAHVTAGDSTVITGVRLWPSHTFHIRGSFPPVTRNPVGP